MATTEDALASSNGAPSLELAWDGHRVAVVRSGDEVRMVSIDLRDAPEGPFVHVSRAIARLPAKQLVIEGFLCALDEKLRPSFELLRAHAAGKRARVVLAVSDLLHLDGDDLRGRPFAERRARLVSLLEGHGEPLVLSGLLPGDVASARAAVRAMNAPGVLLRRDGEAPCVIGDAPLDERRSLSPPPTVTNANKVLYPRDGLTKRALFERYADLAEALLPYLRDRPMVCQRWPDGIDDFTWYQHRLPPRAPDYLRGVMIEGNRRIVIDNRDALLWMVNQAALTFHGFASRVATLQSPDWVVLDLDPSEGTPWEDTIAVASAVRKLLELLELPSVVKTSGQKGLHVLVPLAAGHTVQAAHEFATRFARLIAKTLPDKVTLESARELRGRRVYLDHLQNFVGKTLVVPYSLRATDGAPLSTPLSWSEVTSALDPRAFTHAKVRARLDAHGDLAAPLLAGTARLGRALARLPE